ncbi:MAG TPA: hypothetical protein VEA99_09445 [Gemmatimonadaceae bacterium]|nr:hypothetical protein [Gemmatimonadaceae bacterium]
MFGHLRTKDRQLFAQLAGITSRLSHSTALLARLLDGPHAAAAPQAVHPGVLNGVLHARDDVHTFTAFAMRMDRMEYRDLALALDAAASAVWDATVQASELHATGTEPRARELAALLGDAAGALHEAVPHVGRDPAIVHRYCTNVREHADAGAALYYAGVERLVAQSTNAVETLRAKQISDVLLNALDGCARTAVVLDRLRWAD